jgi:hypothetical protein
MPLSGTWEHRFLKHPFIHVAITALLFPAARPHCLIEEPEALYPVLMFVSNGGKSTRGRTGGNRPAGLTSQAIHNSHSHL